MKHWLVAAGLVSIGVAFGIQFLACSSNDVAGTPSPDAQADAGEESSDLVIAQQGNFFVGGRTATIGCPDAGTGAPPPDAGCQSAPSVRVPTPLGDYDSDQNGSFGIDGTYVHFQIPNKRLPTSVLMVPGAGLTGATFESTPDGREGWATTFLRGHRAVYLMDLPGTGRSPWARTPQIWPDQVVFFQKDFLWLTFRFGDTDGYSPDAAKRKPFDGLQFPIETFDQFVLESGAYWGQDLGRMQTGIQLALEKMGPSTLLVHSASCQLALNVAVARPDLVKALILIEPSGGGQIAAADLPKVKGVPILIVYGDFILGSIESLFVNSSVALVASIKAAGGDATLVELPTIGIKGNSHMMMLDKNNVQVAGELTKWLASKNL